MQTFENRNLQNRMKKLMKSCLYKKSFRSFSNYITEYEVSVKSLKIIRHLMKVIS